MGISDKTAARGSTSSSSARSLTEEDDQRRITPLHIALWNGNLQQIESGLQADANALETRDPRGNRALHLALKFAHRNSKIIVKKLLDAGARVRSRDLDGWKTIHHAIASENEDIMKLLIQREKAQAPGVLHKKISDVAPRLAAVPDFYCEILVDVSTWIPGVSRWLPSDTVKIWKRGEDLRFDITLVGFENGGWLRGNLSFLLLGNDHQFLCLDKNEKSCTNLLCPGASLQDSDLDNMVHFLLTTSIMTTDVDVSALQFTPKRSWLTNAEIVEDIGAWKKCGVIDMSGMAVHLLTRRPQNKNHKAPGGDENSSATKDALAALQEATATPQADVTVEAKADHVVSVELAANETLKWRVSIEDKDILFSVHFFAGGGGSDDDDSNNNKSDTAANNRMKSDPWQQVVAPFRLSKEVAGSFTAPNGGGTVVLKWDNNYSMFRQKHIRFELVVDASDTEASSTQSDDWDSHRATERLVTFEEWFGVRIEDLPDELRELHPKNRIMVHDQPPCRTMSKAFPAAVYMCDSFPFTVHEFLPVIEVLSKTTSAFENVREFFNASLEGGFPVQFCFPLVPSVRATFRFDKMELGTPDAALFSVPSEYRHFQEDLLSPRTHNEMLQNLTAV